jgi:hypothetical protein
MHPCREYWGQDVAYGSLVTGERARRGERAGALTEVWILDLRSGARAAPHADLAGVLRRIGGLDSEESMRQSAAHLKAFLATEPAPASAPTGIERAYGGTQEPDGEQNILGIAALHRTRMLPPGSFAAAAGVPSKAAREASSALLCAEFMRHLGELGAGDDVSRIDWVMVRAADKADGPRSHLGATRVANVALRPFAPGDDPRSATAAASWAEDPGAA